MNTVYGPERKPLGHPATTRLLQRLWPEPVARVQSQIGRTRYVIRHRGLGLFYMGLGPAGQRWGGAAEIAESFEFMTGALSTILYHFDEGLEQFEIVPVVG